MFKVEIEGSIFTGFIEEGNFISVYDVLSEDDAYFVGRFTVEGNDLVEIFPMSNTKRVIGKIIEATR